MTKYKLSFIYDPNFGCYIIDATWPDRRYFRLDGMRHYRDHPWLKYLPNRDDIKKISPALKDII